MAWRARQALRCGGAVDLWLWAGAGCRLGHPSMVTCKGDAAGFQLTLSASSYEVLVR